MIWPPGFTGAHVDGIQAAVRERVAASDEDHEARAGSIVIDERKDLRSLVFLAGPCSQRSGGIGGQVRNCGQVKGLLMALPGIS